MAVVSGGSDGDAFKYVGGTRQYTSPPPTSPPAFCEIFMDFIYDSKVCPLFFYCSFCMHSHLRTLALISMLEFVDLLMNRNFLLVGQIVRTKCLISKISEFNSFYSRCPVERLFFKLFCYLLGLLRIASDGPRLHKIISCPVTDELR